MAKGIYVGVGNAARKITKAYVGVGGVARKIVKGYVGVNGIAHEIFSGGGPLINTLPIGSMIRFGSDYAKNKGNAGESNYYLVGTSYGGTNCCVMARWKVDTQGYAQSVWNSSYVTGYSGTTLDNYFTGTAYNALDAVAKAYLTNVSVQVYNSGMGVTTISRSIFVPSRMELFGTGDLGSAITYLNNESPRLVTWLRDDQSANNALYCAGTYVTGASKIAGREIRAIVILSPTAKYNPSANSDGSYNIA